MTTPAHVDAETGEVVHVLDATEARALTDRIKVAVEATWHLVIEAYQARAWVALGYSSWDDYCTREFGTSRLRLPREERQEVVADTGTYYVRSDKAKWEELLAGRQVRERNVELAQKRLDAYDEALDTLRPHMEDTGRTVAEAVRSLGKEAA
jgi:hypothetical protein